MAAINDHNSEIAAIERAADWRMANQLAWMGNIANGGKGRKFKPTDWVKPTPEQQAQDEIERIKRQFNV